MNPLAEPEAKRRGCGWTLFIVCVMVCPLVLSVEDFGQPLSWWANLLILPAFFCILLTLIGGMACRVITVPFLGWLALPGLVGLACHWLGTGMLTAAIVVDALLLAVAGFALFTGFKRRQPPASSLDGGGVNPGPKFRRDKPNW